jgi:hypothetical protein
MFLEPPDRRSMEKTEEAGSASPVVLLRRSPYGVYCFFVGAFLAPFASAAFLSDSLPPISVNESAALNGYVRTEVSVSPAALKVTSTRRAGNDWVFARDGYGATSLLWRYPQYVQ